MNEISIEKKEIYFTKDVIKYVANKNNVTQRKVEEALTQFLSFYKQYIEDTSYIMYDLPYLGEMTITISEAKREIERISKRYQREKNKVEKERLANAVSNSRIRLKKIKIEVAKLKKKRGYFNRFKRNRMIVRKNGFTKPEPIKNTKLYRGETFEEVIRRQNEYAYKHYKKLNKPVE